MSSTPVPAMTTGLSVESSALFQAINSSLGSRIDTANNQLASMNHRMINIESLQRYRPHFEAVYKADFSHEWMVCCTSLDSTQFGPSVCLGRTVTSVLCFDLLLQNRRGSRAEMVYLFPCSHFLCMSPCGYCCDICHFTLEIVCRGV